MLLQEIHQKVFDLLMDYHQKDEHFLFTLRQLNRNGRLDKGYWFLGNDHYLAISFWLANDNVTKTPRASFIITSEGSSYLELNSKTYDSKVGFFPEFLLKRIGLKEIYPTGLNRKFYSQFKNDFVASLKEFIQKDKNIIDDYVSQFNSGPLPDDVVGMIEFIWTSEFNKQLKIVRKYQELRADRGTKTGYLRSIHIDNFGPINNLSIGGFTNDCRWIFLTGENGAGKTSLLRALAASLTNNNDHGEIVAKNYPDFAVKLMLSTIDGAAEHTVRGTDPIVSKRMLTKGLAVYGPVRLLTQGSLGEEFRSLDEKHISHQTTFGLFNPIGILRDVSGSYVLGVKPKVSVYFSGSDHARPYFNAFSE